MDRKLQLSKGAFLWEAGDNAHTIAILEKGRLGVKVENRIVGIISPKMVLGEAAISRLEGQAPKRTATVVALEDETNVVEYPAELVKKTFDSGNDMVTQLILKTLIGQVCRNGLLVISTHKDHPLLTEPVKSLMQGIVNAKSHIATMKEWDDFSRNFKFMCQLRDFSEALRREHVAMTSDKSDLIEKASAHIKEMFKDDEDLGAMLEDFIQAEEQKDDWLERD